MNSIPRLDTEHDVLPTIPGNPPNLLALPKGCAYQDRCHRVQEHCQQEQPQLIPFAGDRLRACFSDQGTW